MFRVLVSVGLFGLGFLLGRELGRAEAIRDRLAVPGGARRVSGTTLDSDDYTVLEEPAGVRPSTAAGRRRGG